MTAEALIACVDRMREAATATKIAVANGWCGSVAATAAFHEANRLLELERFFASVPLRDLVQAYGEAYPGRDVDPVDVLRWVNTIRIVHQSDRAIATAALVAEGVRLDALESALGEWARLRREIRTLTAERNAITCEIHEQPRWVVEEDGVNLPHYPSDGVPCWKRWEDGPEDRERAPEAQWCASCRRRQRLSQQLVPMRRRHGALLRSLQRRGLRISEAVQR